MVTTSLDLLVDLHVYGISHSLIYGEAKLHNTSSVIVRGIKNKFERKSVS